MNAVEVHGVSRAYVIPHAGKKNPVQRVETFLRGSARGESEAFYALRDITFDVPKGQTIGIVGHNGSGKSTLLKIIAGILRPSTGTVKVEGTVSPLLELGMSFQKELTTVENIYLYGGYLGLPRNWMDGRVDSILEFADLGRFRDAKIKTFSTGMRARLAFSVAIQVEPDVLLLDEVFAVGDFRFKQKCLREMERFKEGGVTILFVSHDMGAVGRFCDRAVLLDHGSMVFDGNTDEALEQYVYRQQEKKPASKEKPAAKEKETAKKDAAPQSDAARKKDEPFRFGDGRVTVEAVEFLDAHGNQIDTVRSGDPLRIRLRYRASERVADPVFGVSIETRRRIRVYGTNSKILNRRIEAVEGGGYVDFAVPSFPLSDGEYLVTVAVHDWSDPETVYDRNERAYSFNVANPHTFAGEINLGATFEVDGDV